MENVGMALTKKDFPSVFKSAWDRCATFDTAVSGLRRSGMFPFDVNGIDKSQLGPSRLISNSFNVNRTPTDGAPLPANRLTNVATTSVDVQPSADKLTVHLPLPDRYPMNDGPLTTDGPTVDGPPTTDGPMVGGPPTSDVQTIGGPPTTTDGPTVGGRPTSDGPMVDGPPTTNEPRVDGPSTTY